MLDEQDPERIATAASARCLSCGTDDEGALFITDEGVQCPACESDQVVANPS